MKYKLIYECKKCGEFTSYKHLYECPNCGKCKGRFRQLTAIPAPEINDKFVYQGRKYRCDGFIKAYEFRTTISKGVWCKPEEATHVTGVGGASCIVKIEDVKWLDEEVNWSEETKLEMIDSYYKFYCGKRLVGC